MAEFAYIARDPAGARQTGRVDASSHRAAVADLEARRLMPVEVKEVAAGGAGLGRLFQKRISVRTLSTSYRQVADLLRAGVPLLRTLRLLGRGKSNPRLAKVMGQVADSVADGEALAEAMKQHPDVFPSVHVAMVRAGERGGFLEPVLARMSDSLEQQAETRSRVLGNLFYPVILLVVAAGVIAFGLLVLVPKYETFLTGTSMPTATKVLLGVSHFANDFWWIVVAAIIGVIAAFFWARNRPPVRRAVARFFLRVPLLKQITGDLAVSRFARVLGTLLENGIPLLPAMKISRDAVGNILLAEALDDAAESVRAGESLAGPLEASGLFGEDVLEVISVGESANNLPSVLGTLAETIERRVDRMLATLVRLMEPALLLCLGGVVFFIFFALVMPMLRMSSEI